MCSFLPAVLDSASQDTSAIRRAFRQGGSWRCPGSDSRARAGASRLASRAAQRSACRQKARGPQDGCVSFPLLSSPLFSPPPFPSPPTDTLFVERTTSEDFSPFWSSTEIVGQFGHLSNPDHMSGTVLRTEHIRSMKDEGPPNAYPLGAGTFLEKRGLDCLVAGVVVAAGEGLAGCRGGGLRQEADPGIGLPAAFGTCHHMTVHPQSRQLQTPHTSCCTVSGGQNLTPLTASSPSGSLPRPQSRLHQGGVSSEGLTGEGSHGCWQIQFLEGCWKEGLHSLLAVG